MLVLQGHTDAVRCLCYAPDGQTLVSGSDDGTVKLWDLTTGKVLHERKPATGIESVAISPHGALLAAGTTQGRIELWKLAELRACGSIEGHHQGVRALAFSADGQWLLSGGWDGLGLMSRVQTRQRMPSFIKGDVPITALVMAPEGRVASGSYDGKVDLWNYFRTGKPPLGLQQSGPAVFALAVSPDGHLLAAGDADGVVQLWELPGGKPRGRLKGHDWAIYSLSFTPDGRCLLSGSADGTVRLWDVASGQERSAFRWHQSWVTCVAFSPDGMTAAAGSADQTIVVWDVE